MDQTVAYKTVFAPICLPYDCMAQEVNLTYSKRTPMRLTKVDSESLLHY